MRAAGKLAAQVLDFAGTLIKPGVTTEEIDRAVHQMIVDNGAYPSPLNYGKFPKSVCTSVNEVVCHGIPDDRQLQDGDILNVDVTVYLNGYHGDTSRMYYVGGCRAAWGAARTGCAACWGLCGDMGGMERLAAAMLERMPSCWCCATLSHPAGHMHAA
jgi:methionine aminopeptidase